MRILICGDRNWTNKTAIKRELESLVGLDITVIHGTCRGADTMAGEAAKELGYNVEEYPADWARYGRAAGPIRNKQMLEEGRPDRVWAFHKDLSKSKGTKNMVMQAREKGILTAVFPPW